MKITILEGYAVNPGDLSYSPLEAFGSVKIYPRTPQNLVAEYIADSDAILVNKTIITREILLKCPNLKYIGVQATGYNVIDIEACRERGITVTNVPAYSTSAVAQLVFAFISEFACHTMLHSDSVMAGDWCRSKDFCYWKKPLTELDGKTLGIFGYGNIGSRVAKIAEAYGMKCIVTTRTPRPGINNVDFDTLLSESDFITLHAPLTPKTEGIINSASLAKMKKTACLINTARGPLVVEKDVRKALDDGTISFYAADVVSKEPMTDDNPLLGAPNCIITPHIAWAATETRSRLMNVVIQNLRSFIEGKPQNVVS
ncbi:MAG TPA: glycerate dehydrogenase [Treponema sp.]|jgi:glycerate dehydrogenase|nr:glycerate dehydrogenase [Treponema sp.]